MDHIENINKEDLIKIINDNSIDTYLHSKNNHLYSEIEVKLIYGKDGGEGRLLCIGEEILTEVVNIYTVPVFYDNDEKRIEMFINHNTVIVAENISEEMIRKIINSSTINKEAKIIDENKSFNNKTILERIFEENYCFSSNRYIKKLVTRGNTLTLDETESLFDRLFSPYHNYYTTRSYHKNLGSIVTFIMDNVKIKTTNMKIDRSKPLGSACPEFGNKELTFRYKRNKGLGLINLDFYKHANVDFLYEQNIGQLCIKFNDILSIDLFDIDSKEFLKLINLRETIREEVMLERESRDDYNADWLGGVETEAEFWEH